MRFVGSYQVWILELCRAQAPAACYWSAGDSACAPRNLDPGTSCGCLSASQARLQAHIPSCALQDATPVKQHDMCKSITVEDSFKSCTSLAAAQTVLRVLAPDLLHRLGEELQVCFSASRRPWKHQYSALT